MHNLCETWFWLSAYMDDKDLDFDSKLKLMCESTSALAHMHNQTPSIVHEEISPGNILIKVVVYSDFTSVINLYSVVYFTAVIGHCGMFYVTGLAFFFGFHLKTSGPSMNQIVWGNIYANLRKIQLICLVLPSIKFCFCILCAFVTNMSFRSIFDTGNTRTIIQMLPSQNISNVIRCGPNWSVGYQIKEAKMTPNNSPESYNTSTQSDLC